MRITGATTCIVGNPWKNWRTAGPEVRSMIERHGRFRVSAARVAAADQDARPSRDRAL